MCDRNTGDGGRGQGKARIPENHGHEAQGAEGGKGGKQGVWTAPAGKRGQEIRGGPDCCGGRPRGRLHPAHEVRGKPRVPNPGHEARACVKATALMCDLHVLEVGELLE